MNKKVTTIPATINKFNKSPISKIKKRRVAGYARVSTDHEDQQSSYDAQVDYYTNYIKNREDWEFVEVYTDEGISATNTKKRAGFNRMIKDALDGKIDLIITKSVSRFARNTVDSLSTIRKLKENGTEVYFEKESIWTFDSKGELLITIMSSLAQEESRSISENCTWGQRKRFADGKVTVPFCRFLGYDRGKNGELIVNQEQAKTVRRIYALFLQGYSPSGIARILTKSPVKSPGGCDKWNASNIRSILQNEKYKGDALLQKTFTVDFLTKKKKKNEGEIPQYYVKDNHEAIIKPSTFDRVQKQLVLRKGAKISSISIFSSKLVCENCGSFYGSKVWHSTDKYKRKIWQCNSKFKNNCKTPHLTEDQIKDVFIKATNKLIKNRTEIIENHKEIIKVLFNTKGLEEKQTELENEVNIVANLINEEIDKNSKKKQNQEEYEKRYNDLFNRFESAKAELEKVVAEIRDKQSRQDMIETFIEDIEKQEIMTEFNNTTWCNLIDKITVCKDNKFKVLYLDGSEIKVDL